MAKLERVARKTQIDADFDSAMSAFEDRIKIQFQDKNLLRAALTRKEFAKSFEKTKDTRRTHHKTLEGQGNGLVNKHSTQFVQSLRKSNAYISNELAAVLRSNAFLGRFAYETGMMLGVRSTKNSAEATSEEARLQIIGSTVEAFLAALRRDKGEEAALAFLEKYIFATSFVKNLLIPLFNESVSTERKEKLLKKLTGDEALTLTTSQRRAVITPTYGDPVRSEDMGRYLQKQFEVNVIRKFLFQNPWLLLGKQGDTSPWIPLKM